MDLSLLMPESLLAALVAAMALIAAAITLVLRAGSWLPRLLGGLDRFLTRIGFGSYTARFLTWMENRRRESPRESDGRDDPKA